MIIAALLLFPGLASAQCPTLKGKDGSSVEDCDNRLSRLWESSTADLLKSLRAEQPESGYAAEVLALQKRPEALPALTRALQESKSPRLRAAAAVSLGFLADEKAVPALLAAASDPDERVREAAVGAGLLRLGRPGLEALFGLIEKSGDPDLKVSAMGAVSQVVDSDALMQNADPALLRAVDVFLSDARCARGFPKAVGLLRFQRPPDTLPLLEKSLRILEGMKPGSPGGRELYDALYGALDAHAVPLIHPLVREMLFEKSFRFCDAKEHCREKLSALLTESRDWR